MWLLERLRAGPRRVGGVGGVGGVLAAGLAAGYSVARLRRVVRGEALIERYRVGFGKGSATYWMLVGQTRPSGA